MDADHDLPTFRWSGFRQLLYPELLKPAQRGEG
jgi:hypothetical protein